MSDNQILSQYKIDFTDVVKELQLELNDNFTEFLNNKFRVNNRKGKTAQNLSVKIDGSIVTLTSTTYSFPKRYVRFLVKKFLASKIKDESAVVKVTAHLNDKSCYTVRCIVSDEEEEQ